MNKEQQHPGEGTSVDPGNQSPGGLNKSLPMAAGAESQVSVLVAHSGPQRTSEVNSKDHELNCPECGHIIQLSQPVENGMEVMEESYNQDLHSQDSSCDKQKFLSQVAVNQIEWQKILKDLKSVTSEECRYDAERLMNKSNNNTPIEPNELLAFYSRVVDSVRPPEPCQTSHKGRKISKPMAGGSRHKESNSSSSSSRSWSCTRVRVFSVVTGQTFGADNSILEQVKNGKWPLISRWPCVDMTTDLQECDVIITFCPIMSRVGSDVEAAMKNTAVSSGQKPAILVLMHHTRDVDYSTGARKWSENHQNIKLEVHVLFHETQPGLLKCQRNDQAVSEIRTLLHTYSKWNYW